MRFNVLDLVALVLIIVGGVNWGLIGAFDFNLVDALFGEGSVLSRIVYILVGIAALYAVMTASKVANRTSSDADVVAH